MKTEACRYGRAARGTPATMLLPAAEVVIRSKGALASGLVGLGDSIRLLQRLDPLRSGQ